jgi:hypothetical protein
METHRPRRRCHQPKGEPGSHGRARPTTASDAESDGVTVALIRLALGFEVGSTARYGDNAGQPALRSGADPTGPKPCPSCFAPTPAWARADADCPTQPGISIAPSTTVAADPTETLALSSSERPRTGTFWVFQATGRDEMSRCEQTCRLCVSSNGGLFPRGLGDRVRRVPLPFAAISACSSFGGQKIDDGLQLLDLCLEVLDFGAQQATLLFADCERLLDLATPCA